MNVMKFVVFSSTLSLLTACGGGGGGGGSDTPETLTFSLVSPSVIAAENNSAVVGVNAKHSADKSISYNIADLPAGVTVSVNGSQLVLTVPDLSMATYQQSYQVTASAGSKEVSDTLTISWVNTSGEVAAEKAQILISAADSISADPDVARLKEFYEQAAYITGEELTSSSVSSSSFGALNIDALEQAYSDYAAQHITQSELEAATNIAIGVLEANASEEISGMSVATLPTIPALSLTLNTDDNTWSFFVGNEAFGQEAYEKWQYTDEFEFLEKLLDSTINVCMNTSI